MTGTERAISSSTTSATPNALSADVNNTNSSPPPSLLSNNSSANYGYQVQVVGNEENNGDGGPSAVVKEEEQDFEENITEQTTTELEEQQNLQQQQQQQQLEIDNPEKVEESDNNDSGKSESSSSSSSSSSSGGDGDSGSNRGSSRTMDWVIKLRGLPWSCTKEDIVDFLGSDCKIYKHEDGIHMLYTPEGKASGEALVECASSDDQDIALKKDKRNMGHRYIEVFKITRSEMEWVLKRNRPLQSSNGSSRIMGSSDCFVRLRGLPYDCLKEDIFHFFHGLEIVSNGIQLMVDGMGRSSGEAYVQFSSKDQVHKALGKDRQMIKHRYVEIFTVSPTELRNMQSMVSRGGRGSGMNRSGPYDRPGGKNDRYGGGGGGGRMSSRYGGRGGRGFDNDSWNDYDSWGGGGGGGGMKRDRDNDGNTRHCVLMRGLPYRASESDIRKFFSPLSPTAIHIIYESSGRPSGTAKVNFNSNDEVTRAMAKHKDRMEHRYIELFVHRT